MEFCSLIQTDITATSPSNEPTNGLSFARVTNRTEGICCRCRSYCRVDLGGRASPDPLSMRPGWLPNMKDVRRLAPVTMHQAAANATGHVARQPDWLVLPCAGSNLEVAAGGLGDETGLEGAES